MDTLRRVHAPEDESSSVLELPLPLSLPHPLLNRSIVEVGSMIGAATDTELGTRTGRE